MGTANPNEEVTVKLGELKIIANVVITREKMILLTTKDYDNSTLELKQLMCNDMIDCIMGQSEYDMTLQAAKTLELLKKNKHK